MPKPRRNQHKSVSFAVSGWQSKRARTNDQSVLSYTQQYCEVSAPFAVARGGSAESLGKQLGCTPASASSYRGNTTEGEHVFAKNSPAPHPDAVQQWRSKKRVADNNRAPEPANPVSSLCNSPIGNVDENITDVNSRLEGVCFISFLPNGNCSGHLVDRRTRSSYGVTGQKLLGSRECTRDEEWNLLAVTLVDFRRAQEWSILVQRTGGDAASLTAPVQLQGVELECDLLRSRSSDVQATLSFSCCKILTEDAAEQHLCTFNPKLCGRNALVNQGVMIISGLPLPTDDAPEDDAADVDRWVDGDNDDGDDNNGGDDDDDDGDDDGDDVPHGRSNGGDGDVCDDDRCGSHGGDSCEDEATPHVACSVVPVDDDNPMWM